MTDPARPGPSDLQKFGLLFAGLAGAGAVYAFWAGSGLRWWLVGCMVVFAVSGLWVHALLRPVYTVWMAFAAALGWLNTRILLGLVFYLVITPVGLLFRLIGKRLIDKRPEPKAPTYWKPRTSPPYERRRSEHLF